MDQTKPKSEQPEKKDAKPLNSVEIYQRRWEQLMEDTNKQLAKIREEENARQAKQTSPQ